MMQIFATFEHSIRLELALSALEKLGIQREHILAVPLTNRKVNPRLFDTMHNSDGLSPSGIGASLGTATSVVTTSIGFSLAWGPIYWGLIGAAAGFLAGVGIAVVQTLVKQSREYRLRGKNPQVVLIVQCEQAQVDDVESALWHHHSLGLARLRNPVSQPAQRANGHEA